MFDFKKLIPPKATPEHAYEMGVDKAVNGANSENCHVSIFATAENTRQWEKGVHDGLKKLANLPEQSDGAEAGKRRAGGEA